MQKLKIVYEDKYLIVVNKPHNLLTIATEKEKLRTLYHEVLTYEQKKHKNNRIFIVHRLDKETSGLVIFAKSQEVKEALQNNWDEVKRYYVALLEGKVEKSGEIKSYLKETKTLLTYSSNDKKGKFAFTKYQPLKTQNKFSLVEIQILTGRKNQIRVHMQDIKHPIVGDVKYGSKYNPIKQMCLTAQKLEFIHPITKENLKLEIDTPKEYLELLEKK